MTGLTLWRFVSSPLGRYLIGGLAVLIALGSAYGYVRVHYYNEGFNAAIAKIAARDKEAIDAVNKQLKIVDDCAKSGRAWDTVTGVCR